MWDEEFFFQLGQYYELHTKNSGKTKFSEIKRIIEYAENLGITNIDTAIAYGDAENILGRVGVKNFKVTSCYGHIRDLPKDDKSIDKENGFQPSYVPSPDKKKVIKELQSLKKRIQILQIQLCTFRFCKFKICIFKLINFFYLTN